MSQEPLIGNGWKTCNDPRCKERPVNAVSPPFVEGTVFGKEDSDVMAALACESRKLHKSHMRELLWVMDNFCRFREPSETTREWLYDWSLRAIDYIESEDPLTMRDTYPLHRKRV